MLRLVVHIGAAALTHVKAERSQFVPPALNGEYSSNILSKRCICGCHIIVTVRIEYWNEQLWLIRVSN